MVSKPLLDRRRAASTWTTARIASRRTSGSVSLQRLGQRLGRGGVGVADVAQLEHGLAAHLRLGVVEVRDPGFHLPAARQDRPAFLAAAARQRDDRRENASSIAVAVVSRIAIRIFLMRSALNTSRS